MGVQGLYNDGWMLSAVPVRPPWELLGKAILNPAAAYKFELYDVRHDWTQNTDVAAKNPAIGVVLSFFIPGLGTMVNGSAGRGVLILALYAVGWLLSFFLIGIPILIGAWIWGLVDGYTSAQRWNRKHGIVS